MKHSEQCECDACKTWLYSMFYRTSTEDNEVTSIDKINGKWYVNYTTTFKDGSTKDNFWPIETWNKYAKINWEKKHENN